MVKTGSGHCSKPCMVTIQHDMWLLHSTPLQQCSARLLSQENPGDQLAGHMSHICAMQATFPNGNNNSREGLLNAGTTWVLPT